MKKTDQKGFTAIEAILIVFILVILGGIGWWVYHKNHKNTVASTASHTTATTSSSASTQADLYAGWKTCDDGADGVSFKYPSTWTANGLHSNSDPCAGISLSSFGQEVSFQSPSSGGLSFSLKFFPAVQNGSLKEENSAPSSTGGSWEAVQSVAPLALNTGNAASLVSYEDIGTNTKVSDNLVSAIGLTNQSYSAGQLFHDFSGITSPKNSNYNVQMYVSLISATSESQSVQSYSSTDYQSQPAYKDLMNIFKSVTY